METSTADATGSWLEDGPDAAEEVMALLVAWSLDEPERVGEVALVGATEGCQLLGRGPGSPDDRHPRMVFLRQRPGHNEATGPLASQRLSRRQLEVRVLDGALQVANLGRSALRIEGRPAAEGLVRAGDVLVLERTLVLLVTTRPRFLPAPTHPGEVLHDFGTPDADGIVGECPATWALRAQVAFLASRQEHVLLTGDSGVGKELVGRALHRRSHRSARPLVARNASTLPEGLVDAELFGNIEGYPNPGMRGRRGLIGDADGSTLLLDEIGELDQALQAHLLRVLDADGEYQRLGEARTRRADLRVVAATNRPPSALKHDLLARLPLRLHIDGLNARRDDVPLLAVALLRKIAADDRELGARFFEGQQPRVSPELVAALLRTRWTHHVRELQAALWASMRTSQGAFLALTDEVVAALRTPRPARRSPADLDPAEVQAALDRCSGNQARAYRELGLASRDQLYRLIKKHGLVVRRDP